MYSLVAVVKTGVTAHGFEHYLLGDVEIGGKTFCHMRQRNSGYVLEGVGDAVNDALGISGISVGHFKISVRQGMKHHKGQALVVHWENKQGHCVPVSNYLAVRAFQAFSNAFNACAFVPSNFLTAFKNGFTASVLADVVVGAVPITS